MKILSGLWPDIGFANELWRRINKLCEDGTTISSLTGRSWHTIESMNSPYNTGDKCKYRIRYKSGGTADVKVAELCELYHILWKDGRLTDEWMKNEGYKSLGWKRWFTPGSAMLAIIPYLDDRIVATKSPAGLKVNH